MALVKAREFERKQERKQVFNLSDIAAEGRAIIDAANKERDRILNQAQAEIKQELEAARQKGRKEGFDAGFEQGKKEGFDNGHEEARAQFIQENGQAVQILNGVLEYFDKMKERLLWQAEQETVVFALGIAEKVIKKTAEKDPAVARENVKAALELISGNTNVTIQVNPKDMENLEDMLGSEKRIFSQFKSVNFEPDESISLGGCSVMTGHGQIDAQLDTQLERIASELVITPSSEADTE